MDPHSRMMQRRSLCSRRRVWAQVQKAVRDSCPKLQMTLGQMQTAFERSVFDLFGRADVPFVSSFIACQWAQSR